ncbi:GNAT family N-acetyltransferase [Komagataeibacter nataicola]|uniref:GNAT family N-acetyltransferase n=1 Tax=Komagataeibacter nataicola TaxID=265960 RepID=A0A9N7CHC6_9PROT|nr:GNAT family N-acetyltransferase [Komagataeibacter nataicola]AQU87485.1 GNAT family N-acetyltransferase [Komagataeibacter nataicola]PYD65976.1 GNAT family N-acetyltransferase [Komagataeibacter nataicola]WEQ55225.1 GNAT family N-acetyltransferase [Komagataeibacter nataicola]WNM09894.1 GNAT family N-acetyltransferase [Komagataeibacter nataicola]GBR19373.1 acetyltransferase [Komagataeibacter nataicola NRIC 0616]
MGCRCHIQTGHLQLDPVSWTDLEDVVRLKASAGVTGRLAGGVCNRVLSEQDMLTDLMTWGREGVGMFTVRQQGRFIGLAGVQPSTTAPDCHELQFTMVADVRDTALSREATTTALAFAHDGGVSRVIAYVREHDIVARQVFGGAGMSVCTDQPERCGPDILLYHSLRGAPLRASLH